MSVVLPPELRIQDFAPVHRQDILEELDRLLREWRQSAWIRVRASERRALSVQSDMHHWCRAFIKFYVAVKLKGQPIEPAFVKWARDHATQAERAAMPDTFDKIDRALHLNVCMMQFSERYWKARNAYYAVCVDNKESAI